MVVPLHTGQRVKGEGRDRVGLGVGVATGRDCIGYLLNLLRKPQIVGDAIGSLGIDNIG